MFRVIEGGKSKHATPAECAGSNEHICRQAREHVQRLMRIAPVINVCIFALRAQAADFDEEIADVLHQHVRLPLEREIEELETLLASRATQTSET